MSSQGHHAHAATEILPGFLPTPLANTDRVPPGDTTPNLSNTREPKLPAIQESRASLSQSLRPAEPPEKGEREGGEQEVTLKVGAKLAS
jgi:hypothetical protein